MGLMDKFKNLFTDEEVIEEEEDSDSVEIREVKKEEVNKLPTFMREKIEKEEQTNFKDDNKLDDIEQGDSEIRELKIERESITEKLDSDDGDSSINNSFKFPIDITDNDFIETRSRQSLHQNQSNRTDEIKKQPVTVKSKVKDAEKKVSELYKDKKDVSAKDEKKFRATPIISPIYGVLDKNYDSSDIKENTSDNFSATRPSKSVDFDSVRKKAYGNLNDEIKENLMCENCEYLKEAKECEKNKVNKNSNKDNLVYEILEEGNIEENYKEKDITLDEAAENYFDYGVEYERKQEILEELKEEDKVKIVNHEDEDIKERTPKEIPPVKSSINLLSTLKKSMGDEVKKEDDLELTDDLFNLIDSMYDERDEKK